MEDVDERDQFGVRQRRSTGGAASQSAFVNKVAAKRRDRSGETVTALDARR